MRLVAQFALNFVDWFGVARRFWVVLLLGRRLSAEEVELVEVNGMEYSSGSRNSINSLSVGSCSKLATCFVHSSRSLSLKSSWATAAKN